MPTIRPRAASPEVVRTIRDALPILKGEEKTLVFLSPRLTLPMELQKDIALVDFALPDRAALAREEARCEQQVLNVRQEVWVASADLQRD